jgi:hypothetical protein
MRVAVPIEIRLWIKEIGADYLILRIGGETERHAAEAPSPPLGGLGSPSALAEYHPEIQAKHMIGYHGPCAASIMRTCIEQCKGHRSFGPHAFTKIRDRFRRLSGLLDPPKKSWCQGAVFALAFAHPGCGPLRATWRPLPGGK